MDRQPPSTVVRASLDLIFYSHGSLFYYSSLKERGETSLFLTPQSMSKTEAIGMMFIGNCDFFPNRI